MVILNAGFTSKDKPLHCIPSCRIQYKFQHEPGRPKDCRRFLSVSIKQKLVHRALHFKKEWEEEWSLIKYFKNTSLYNIF